MKAFHVSGLVAAALALAAPAEAQHLSVGVTVHAPPVVVDLSYHDSGYYRPGIVVVGQARPHYHATRVVHVHRPVKHVVVHGPRHPHRCSGLHTHGKHGHRKGHR